VDWCPIAVPLQPIDLEQWPTNVIRAGKTLTNVAILKIREPPSEDLTVTPHVMEPWTRHVQISSVVFTKPIKNGIAPDQAVLSHPVTITIGEDAPSGKVLIMWTANGITGMEYQPPATQTLTILALYKISNEPSHPQKLSAISTGPNGQIKSTLTLNGYPRINITIIAKPSIPDLIEWTPKQVTWTTQKEGNPQSLVQEFTITALPNVTVSWLCILILTMIVSHHALMIIVNG
jgi:hypothetical protein